MYLATVTGNPAEFLLAFVLSMRPYARKEQVQCRWKNFHRISYWGTS
jgi:hypothetical protein